MRLSGLIKEAAASEPALLICTCAAFMMMSLKTWKQEKQKPVPSSAT